MEWSGQKDFVAAPTIPFVVDGAEKGLLKGHGPLTFLKVLLPLLMQSQILITEFYYRTLNILPVTSIRCMMPVTWCQWINQELP